MAQKITVQSKGVDLPVHKRILPFAMNLTVIAVFVRHSSERKGGSATTMS